MGDYTDVLIEDIWFQIPTIAVEEMIKSGAIIFDDENNPVLNKEHFFTYDEVAKLLNAE